jgi:hypothetical protein
MKHSLSFFFTSGAIVFAVVGCGSSDDTAGATSSSNVTASGSNGATSGSGGGAANGTTGAGGNPTSGCSGTGGSPGTPPDLVPGVWKNITPNVSLDGTFGANSIDFDPGNPLTLYASLDMQGLWKSTDGGTSWALLGDPNGIGQDTTNYLDSPLRVAVDPCNSQHLYATQGVRGATMGFWVSMDGGETWTRPPGFIEVAGSTTDDVTTLAVDPWNFGHLLVGSHSPWSQGDIGIIESKDFGQTWTTHAPAGGFPAGSVGIGFGANADTWIVNGDTGTWRTADGGATWDFVSEMSGTHGGAELYRDSTGTLYFTGYQYPYRSTDDGVTWSQLKTGLPYGYYLSIIGDGKNLYTAPSFPDDGHIQANQPYLTSPESDGVTWTAQDVAQPFDNGPYRMRYEPVNGIIYSANWHAGVWAMKPAD